MNIFLQKVFLNQFPLLFQSEQLCLIFDSEFFIFGENQKIGSVFLLLFIIPTTIIFHVFPFHQRAVFINLGLMGGLIIAAIREPK